MINIEELKNQVLQINQQVAAGQSVQINLLIPNGYRSLLVDKYDGVTEFSNARAKNARSKNDGEFLKSYDIELDDVEISTSDISEKIAEASINATKTVNSRVPSVILTKPDNSKWWVIHEACSYTTDAGYTLTVPQGFLTDLASIPRIFWAIIASFELSLAAPVFHDLLYRYKGKLVDGQVTPTDKEFIRREADNIFLEIMKETNVPEWKRTVAYWAVRGFAGFAWKQSNPTL